MYSLTESSLIWAEHFILIALRIMAIFTISPVFGRKNMPGGAKIGFSFLMAYIIKGVLPSDEALYFQNIIQFAVVCIKELSIGLMLGLATTVFFSVVHTAGQIIDMQIGFSIANMFDANTSTHIPLIGGLLQVVLTVGFFAVDGHLILIRLITETISYIPIGRAVVTPHIALPFIRVFIISFVMAVKIALPILGASLLAEIALGIIMRAVPQINFFVIGFPVKVGLGLLILMLFMPAFINSTDWIFESMFGSINNIFEGLAGAS